VSNPKSWFYTVVHDRERAVIEAAKAYRSVWVVDGDDAHLLFNRMMEAVEALQEVEGGL